MSPSALADLMRSRNPDGTTGAMTQTVAQASGGTGGLGREAAQTLISRIERRTTEFNSAPASEAIAALVIVEVTIAPEAEPGEREIRLVTLRGVSTPLSFYVGQLPEVSKKPMVTATQSLSVLRPARSAPGD